MTYQDDAAESASTGFFNHLPAIIWQRRWLVILPLVLLSAVGLIAAALLPTIYRSSATLLVQSPDLPANVADSPETALIDQRIAKIRQQVLSRGDLIALIDQNDLYREERQTRPLSEIIETMRRAVSVQAVAGDIGERPSGDQSNTIAFGMSFDYRDPIKAQAVMQSFVQRFLELDSSSMEERATDSVSFLQDQAARLQGQIADLEGRITSIKAQNGAVLSSTGVPIITGSGGYDAQIIGLQNQNRLLALQNRKTARSPVVVAAEAQLAAARATYAETHPDVVVAKQRLEEIRRDPTLGGADDRAIDVSAVNAQIESNNRQIALLSQAQATERARASAGLTNQARQPVLMQQIMQLESRADVLRQQYEQVSANLLKAQNSARLVQEQKGERLSIVDAPVLPDKPISPNRPLLILAGIAAGLGAGLVLALLVELLLRPVRGVESIEGLGLEPLGVVPTFKMVSRGKRKRKEDLAEPGAPAVAS